MKVKKITIYIFVFLLVVMVSFLVIRSDILEICIEGQVIDNPQPHNVFTNSIYDTVKKYYWKKLSDNNLSQIYHKAFTEVQFPATSTKKYCNTKLGVEKHLEDIIGKAIIKDNMNKLSLNNFVVEINKYVISHLSPEDNISEIVENKVVEERRNLAMNKEPGYDPYKALDVKKSASPGEILKKCKILATSKNITANQMRDCNTLTNEISKDYYDSYGIFRSVESVMDGNILYLRIGVLTPSPVIIQELDEYTNRYFQDNRWNDHFLILDLRRNPGGYFDSVIDILSQFSSYGQELYKIKSQISENPTSTRAFTNPRYKDFDKVIVLIDDETKSAAEVLAEAMKKYSQVIIVGTSTIGYYGTSKNNYPISVSISTSTEYNIWLVNEMILRNDGQLIHNNGIHPDIDTSKSDWEVKLKKEIPENVYSDIKKLLVQ